MHRNFLLTIIVVIIGVMITNLWLAYTPDTLLGKVDAVGYAVCHRIPSHSLTVDGRSLPLCARCSGMYLGALFGTIFQMITGKRRGGFSRRALTFLCVFAIFFVIDGLNSFTGLILDHSPLYEPQNWLRLMTGMSVGLLISAVLYPIFTQTVWQTWKPASAFDGPGAIAALLTGSVLLVIGLLSGFPAILYPLAILSVLGVLVILTLVYSVLLLMLFKQENRYNHFIELTPAILGGLVLTMMQIGLFDLLRFLLTETWNGLPL
ncbi:MAG: DUF2085 domain-containing protein [Anaerolineaceae bacterium]